MTKAQEILARNSEFLSALAQALLEQGTLSMFDVARIRASCRLTAVAI